MTLFLILLKKMILLATLILLKEIVLLDQDTMDGLSPLLESLKNLPLSPQLTKNRWQNCFGENGSMMRNLKDLRIHHEDLIKMIQEGSTNMF